MDNLLETLRQLGPTRLAVMGSILVGLLLFFVFISMRVTAPEMQMLYAELSPSDTASMAAELDKNNIPYELSPDNSEIRVPSPEVSRARMLLAQEGLPNDGSMGYEIFDKQSSFGTTNFVQNINQVRALEGELQKTIASLEPIRSARVHLVLPHKEIFSRDSRESRASVFVTLRSGAEIENQQIEAIRSLVSSAVPGLKTSNVSVVDNNGALLARGGEDENSLMSTKAEEKQRNYEKRLVRKIEDQVAQIVGFGNVRATVTAEINYDRISMNEELYDPAGQVVRSTQTTEENNTERESVATEDVSVGNNLPGVGGDLLVDEKPSLESNRVEEVTNFEISKTIRSTVREVGEVTRLSVAVLVDGRYISGEKGEPVYQERTQQELEQITALVRSAVGFDSERGDSIEVINMQFATVDTDESFREPTTILGFEKADLLDAAEILAVAVMIILVVLLVLQPMVGRLIAAGSQDVDENLEAELLAARPASPALAAPDGKPSQEEMDEIMREVEETVDNMINIDGVEGKVREASVRKVEEIIEGYPAETVSVIRSWMAEDKA